MVGVAFICCTFVAKIKCQLLNSLLLGISSHGYVKNILLVFGYNNFYANIGLALFKM